MIPGKTQWNKKIPIYRYGVIFNVIGIFFLYLTVDSILQQLCATILKNSCTLYAVPYENFFFSLFAVIGFTLGFILPFLAISMKVFRPKIYDEEHIYH